MTTNTNLRKREDSAYTDKRVVAFKGSKSDVTKMAEDRRVVRLSGSTCAMKISLVDYESSEESEEDKIKSKAWTDHNANMINAKSSTGEKRKLLQYEQSLTYASTAENINKKTCIKTDSQKQYNQSSIKCTQLDENSNTSQWSDFRVSDIPLPSPYVSTDTVMSSHTDTPKRKPRPILGRSHKSDSQLQRINFKERIASYITGEPPTSRTVIPPNTSISPRIKNINRETLSFSPSQNKLSDQATSKTESHNKIPSPRTTPRTHTLINKIPSPRTTPRAQTLYGKVPSPRTTPRAQARFNVPPPPSASNSKTLYNTALPPPPPPADTSPFWSSASPTSQLNSPLYGYHSPPSPVVVTTSLTQMNMSVNSGSSPAPHSTVSQQTSASSFLNQTTPDKSSASYSTSQEAAFITPSQIYMPSSLLPPRLRFLQNSCLVNKNKSPTSPAYNIEWKRRFKQTSDSYRVKYVDSHCHLDLLLQRTQFSGSWDKYRAVNADTFPDMYEGCVAVFCFPNSFKADGIWQDIGDCDGVWMTFGCHPKNATEFTPAAEAGLLYCLKQKKTVALGEIGLDYSGTFRQHEQVQKSVLMKQINIALEMKKPLVIHCRDAYEDCFNILSQMVPKNYKIHCHCFTADYAMAKQWLEAFPNLYIGLTPLVTYRMAAATHNVARFIPLDRLLLETDAPYFVPRKVPKDEMVHSHPGMAVTVAEQVAYIKGCTVQEVLLSCRQNTREMYGI